MRFWIREVAGWLLVGLGLLIFYLCFALLMSRQIFEAGSFTMIGIFVFRGGIHLLKVAVAARICMQTQAALHAERKSLPTKPTSPRLVPRQVQGRVGSHRVPVPATAKNG